jgi:hypothetical protein
MALSAGDDRQCRGRLDHIGLEDVRVGDDDLVDHIGAHGRAYFRSAPRPPRACGANLMTAKLASFMELKAGWRLSTPRLE